VALNVDEEVEVPVKLPKHLAEKLRELIDDEAYVLGWSPPLSGLFGRDIYKNAEVFTDAEKITIESELDVTLSDAAYSLCSKLGGEIVDSWEGDYHDFF